MKQHNSKTKSQYSVKKVSNGTQSKELLKTLQKMINQLSGTVSYIFVDDRIENIHSHKMKELTEKQNKATLHVQLSAKAIEEKSPNELIHMFETTKWDLGAKYFVVNS
jgi:hypothetical protein